MPHAWEGGQADGSGMKLVGRRTVLTAAALGLTGCVGGQDDENPGQAEGNATENETGSVENTSDEETTAEEGEPDSEYTNVEDDVYTVESVGSGEYRITADEERLIEESAFPTRDLYDRENPEIIHVSDGNSEIYSKRITEEGNAVVFYDETFANEEPVRFASEWHRDKDYQVIHEDAEVPDIYIDEVEDGLRKVTIPFEDMHEDWDDLKKGASLSITVGHLGDTRIEKGKNPELDPESTNYTFTLTNRKDG